MIEAAFITVTIALVIGKVIVAIVGIVTGREW